MFWQTHKLADFALQSKPFYGTTFLPLPLLAGRSSSYKQHCSPLTINKSLNVLPTCLNAMLPVYSLCNHVFLENCLTMISFVLPILTSSQFFRSNMKEKRGRKSGQFSLSVLCLKSLLLPWEVTG